MSELRFDGRVAVVTGAGAGLGRAYALLLAARGAKVVVNDLGGARDGTGGQSSRPADLVVQEIRQNGGTAVADYNSVTDGDKIIQTALKNYGRIDILINNAGILRDKSFLKLTEKDWDLIFDVHVKGSFKTTHAAFPLFKKQGYGRIVMTSSTSGLYGNFGQANYSAAKMSLIGLTNTLAIEGAKYNIHCNTLVPTAASRLTADILPEDLFKQLKPELIAPIVAYLCHEDCPENGSIIESAAGWAGKHQLARGKGTLLRANLTDSVTIESVKRLWPAIVDLTEHQLIEKGSETLAALMDSLNEQQVGVGKKKLVNYDEKDVILYALSVGASLKNPTDLQFLYENHENFHVLPTFFSARCLQLALLDPENTIPGKSIDLTRVLHGEQYTEIFGHVPVHAKLENRPEIMEVLDKGSGATVVLNVDSYLDGELLVRNQYVIFVVGAGNFGGTKMGKHLIPLESKPDRKPDVIVEEKTCLDQAALYRLTGDINPLHIDPNFSQLAGFKTPILHGLCSYGFSIRLILQKYANNDAKQFKSCKARFIKPALPGDTLSVRMWQNGNRILFETAAIERNVTIISGAYVDLKSIKMGETIKTTPKNGYQSDAIFEYIIEQVNINPDKAKSINAIFQWNITKNGDTKTWTMDLKNGQVYEGKPKTGKPNTTLTLDDEDFILLSENKLEPQVAFMKGKLKITGNIMLAQKLGPILKANAKL